jgi:hypothetical protein
MSIATCYKRDLMLVIQYNKSGVNYVTGFAARALTRRGSVVQTAPVAALRFSNYILFLLEKVNVFHR